MDDLQLLRQYVKDGSQDAFAAIVREHVDLVYGTARRLVGDEQLAEDVAQAAFAVLAQKAKQVEPGWLVNATRLAANEARRSKLCREKHEWRAAQMRSSKSSEDGDEPTLEQLTPLLDEALCRLGEADRTAVAMRFLEGRSFAEVAAAMGSSEEAARKRVERAVEKLRGTFMKKGFAPSVGGLMVVLAAHQAQAAPAGLAGSISATAISGGAGTGAILAKGAMKIMTMAKVKVAAVVVLGLGLAAGVAIADRGSAEPKPISSTTPSAGSLADVTQVVDRCLAQIADIQYSYTYRMLPVADPTYADVCAVNVKWVGTTGWEKRQWRCVGSTYKGQTIEGVDAWTGQGPKPAWAMLDPMNLLNMRDVGAAEILPDALKRPGVEVKGVEIVGGRSAVLVHWKEDPDLPEAENMVWNLWLDMACGGLPVKSELWLRGKLMRVVDEVRIGEIKPGIFFPLELRSRTFGGGQSNGVWVKGEEVRFVVNRESVALNQRLTKDDLSPDFEDKLPIWNDKALKSGGQQHGKPGEIGEEAASGE